MSVNPHDNLRIDASTKKHIVESIRSFDAKANIYLYGSRTKGHLKGGDIDLLVISEVLNFGHKVDLLILLKLKLGEQKIDLTIKKQIEFINDPFFSTLTDEFILIS